VKTFEVEGVDGAVGGFVVAVEVGAEGAAPTALLSSARNILRVVNEGMNECQLTPADSKKWGMGRGNHALYEYI